MVWESSTHSFWVQLPSSRTRDFPVGNLRLQVLQSCIDDGKRAAEKRCVKMCVEKEMEYSLPPRIWDNFRWFDGNWSPKLPHKKATRGHTWAGSSNEWHEIFDNSSYFVISTCLSQQKTGQPWSDSYFRRIFYTPKKLTWNFKKKCFLFGRFSIFSSRMLRMFIFPFLP